MLNLSPALLISRVITLLIAFTFHEFSHAQTAVWLGDVTPRRDGRLTLNPLKHLDPGGCLLLAVIAAVILRSGLIRTNTAPFGLNWLPRPAYFLSQFIWTNLCLMVFNLIPLAPLDGEKVVGYFIPDSFRITWQRIQAEGTKILMLCFFVLPYLGVNFMDNFVSGLSMALYRILVGG